MESVVWTIIKVKEEDLWTEAQREKTSCVTLLKEVYTSKSNTWNDYMTDKKSTSL